MKRDSLGRASRLPPPCSQLRPGACILRLFAARESPEGHKIGASEQREYPHTAAAAAAAAAPHATVMPDLLVPPTNLRDLGGWIVGAGVRVRRGQLYRAGKPSAPGNAAALAALGVRTVYDLRTLPERTKAPDFLPDGCRHVVIDVLGAFPETASTALRTIIGDPTAITSVLQGSDADAIIDELYRGFVAFPSACAAYGTLFRDLLVSEHRPALVHCNAGRDRTGWAVAALLTLIGVSREDVLRDYLLSGGATGAGVGGNGIANESVLLPKLIAGVDECYLVAAFDEVRTRWGTIERYFAEGLGIDAREQRALREALTERM